MATFDEFAELARAVPVALPHEHQEAGPNDFRFDADDDHDDDAHTCCLMIVGRSGTGKSGVLRAIKRRPELAKRTGGPNGDIRPVIDIVVPDNPTPKEVIKDLCARASALPPAKWTRSEVTAHLHRLFGDLCTVYVQMDEAQVFVEGQTARQCLISARFLKFLLVRVGIPIILAGEEPLEELLTYKALERRTHGVVRMRPYGWGDYDETNEFLGITQRMLEVLGHEASTVGSDPGQAMCLYYDTRGVLGLMAKRLAEAAMIARHRGARALELADLSAAWRKRFLGGKEAVVAEDPFIVAQTVASASPEDPYLAKPAALRLLWKDRFHPPVEPVDPSKPTRRRGKNKKKPDRSFGT